MNTEKEMIYEAEPEVADLNENNALKPYAYQKLFSKVVDQHLMKIDISEDKMIKHNLAWALVSMSIEIKKPIEGIAPMYANTWHSGRRGPFFCREFVFRNENNEILFQGSTFSVLLDMEKRTIYRKKELPFPLIEAVEDLTIEASPTNKSNLEFTKVEERKVYNSYIDCLGHVNNGRYGEFAYDTFTEKEKKNLPRLKRMDVYFISELRAGDTFSISKAYHGNKIYCRGYHDSKTNISFEIIYEFSFPCRHWSV